MKHVYNIFIVDENPFFSLLLERTLKNQFLITVNCYDNAKRAVSHMDINPDVIILDYCFFKRNKYTIEGLTALKLLRNLNDNQKVIMVLEEKFIGAVDFKRKPNNLEYIIKDKSAVDKIYEMIGDLLPDVHYISA